MTTQAFQDAYKRLNPAQKQAVDTIDGPVMVVAGPGTGKTQILTLRIANILLKSQINPENILALTFTESGVLAMRKRLVEMIGTAGFKVEINTFHGFCNDIIRRNPEDFDNLISSESVTEVEQIQVIEEVINETKLTLLKPFGDPLYYVRPSLSAINDLKKEGITPDRLKQAIEDQKENFKTIEDLYHEKGAYGPKVRDDGTVTKGQMKSKYQDLQKDIAKNEELLLVFEKYQQALHEKRMYDFNDMLLSVVEALGKDKLLLQRLQETYQYILVDEHQDTNAAQNRLIELIASFDDNPNLFVVGDEKQAIYRFQGASLENFLYFKKLYPGAELINLEENYRSSQTILNAAASVIKQNITAEILGPQKNLHAAAGIANEPIKVIELHDYYAEYHYLASDIAKLIASGVSAVASAKEIAVLARNNRDLLPLSLALEQLSVPFNIESDQNIFEDPNVRKLISLFRTVCGFGSDIELIQFLHNDFLEIPQMDLYRLMNYSKISGKKMFEIINEEDDLKAAHISNPQRFMELYRSLEKWSGYCHNENLESVFVTLLQESGFLTWIMNRPKRYEILDKLTGIYEEMKMLSQKRPQFTLEEFLQYIDLLSEHDILIKKSPKTILKNAVRLMTTHRSKGQEFDYVYMINVYDGHWGNLRRRGKGFKLPWDFLGIKLNLEDIADSNEDERRLFYVALTRARKGVMMSYSTQNLDGKEQVPSQFIEEIEPEFKQLVDTKEFEDHFLDHKEVLFSLPLEDSLSKKDATFLKELFVEKGLSATAVNNYLECPWRYFYHDLLQLPESKDQNLIFGSCIHKAVNTVVREHKNNGAASVEYLLDAFSKALAKEVGTGDIYQILKEKGEKVLPVFYEQDIKNWPKNILTEFVIRGVHLSDEVLLNGMIDMIVPFEGSSQVTVYDFKTGKPKTLGEVEGTTKNSKGNYKRQLVFYKLLLDLYQEGKMKMNKGVIDFVEPDEKGRHQQVELVITDEDVTFLKKQILFIASEIMELKFWDRRCEEADCQYCALRNRMES